MFSIAIGQLVGMCLVLFSWAILFVLSVVVRRICTVPGMILSLVSLFVHTLAISPLRYICLSWSLASLFVSTLVIGQLHRV